MLIIRARLRARIPVMFALGAGLVAGSAAVTPPASAQGLFEALFGPRHYEPAPPVYFVPPARDVAPRHLEQYRQHESRRRLQRERRAARVAPAPPVATPEPEKPGPYVAPPVMPGPLGRFLRDPTLRRGDVVATVNGLMVFRGSPGSRHEERDFVPVARAGSLIASRRTRAELARLDKAVAEELDRKSPSQIARNMAPIVAEDP